MQRDGNRLVCGKTTTTGGVSSPPSSNTVGDGGEAVVQICTVGELKDLVGCLRGERLPIFWARMRRLAMGYRCAIEERPRILRDMRWDRRLRYKRSVKDLNFELFCSNV